MSTKRPTKTSEGGAGATTALTPELQGEITGYIRVGVYVEQACLCAGISKKTYYNWLSKGREGVEPYAFFLHSIEEAEALCELDSVTSAKRRPKPSEALKFLGQRFPTRWRDIVKIEVDWDSLAAKLRTIDRDDDDETESGQEGG